MSEMFLSWVNILFKESVLVTDLPLFQREQNCSLNVSQSVETNHSCYAGDCNPRPQLTVTVSSDCTVIARGLRARWDTLRKSRNGWMWFAH